VVLNKLEMRDKAVRRGLHYTPQPSSPAPAIDNRGEQQSGKHMAPVEGQEDVGAPLLLFSGRAERDDSREQICCLLEVKVIVGAAKHRVQFQYGRALPRSRSWRQSLSEE
jgi:hypothetical protein